ncbi:MAG TPA: glycerophosphodiester phosphodiesterase [Anaerolineae bacterium]|nr:glycerophosphodiester phosphodiesterase [Anaerolineae bacterium]
MSSLWLTADRTLNIAHQGASDVAPPNTLAAFHRAAELGADGVELDVHLSADGVPVVIHDFTVDRTTNGTGRVADFPLAALKKLDAGSRFDPAFAGERIPTLEEVFEAVGRRLLINVELKAVPRENRGLEEAVVTLVERHGLRDRVLISSFDPFALRRVRRLAPHLPLGFLYETAPLSRLARALAGLMRGLQPEAIHPHWAQVRPPTVRRAHGRGRRVVAWTVDEPEVMRRLSEWGVDGIITNRPDRLREVLTHGGTGGSSRG